MVDPLKRLTEVESLIRNKSYFVLHAPRQTGKTTFLHALARKLNTEGNYISAVASFERAGYRSITLEKATEVFIDSIHRASEFQLPAALRPRNPKSGKSLDLSQYLAEWCKSQSKPIVLLIDEIDALFDDVLISVLPQLRDGCQARTAGFPSSVALVGLRDVRDYKIRLRPETESLGTASPFNVKAESIFLSNFSEAEVFESLPPA
ncbi:ATP-binding protein [candidate division KSB1 bacterium]|nr:ATP-binding protein [candidate division KSB1 bacterium]